jgi:hypothetical protein
MIPVKAPPIILCTALFRQQLVDSFDKLNIEFTIQTILYGSETSDYNQNVKLFRAVHSLICHLYENI